MILFWEICFFRRRGEILVYKPQHQKQWWIEDDLKKEWRTQDVHRDLSQKERRVRKNVGTIINQGISRNIAIRGKFC